MPNYASKDELVQGRQLKVQRLVIPFAITGNATASLVAISKDEPALLFIKTEGVDQITPALDSNDGTPSFTAANDANGIFNLMIKINESVGKVMRATVVSRSVVNKNYGCSIADTDGITAGGQKIVLNCDSDVNLSSANLDGCLILEYVVAE